jgi:hypothetical protein
MRGAVQWVLRWPWVAFTLGLVVVLLSGFQAAEAGTLTVEKVAVGIAAVMLLAFWRESKEHQKKIEKSLGRIDTALFGPEDGDGERPEGGLDRDVREVKRQTEKIPALEESIEQVAVQAATAASAAQTAQRMAAAAIAGESRDPRTRTRAADQDDR